MQKLLEGKNAKQRSEIKATEIAKLGFIGRYENAEYGLRIEIQKIEKIVSKGVVGLEIFARAWKKDNQLGFGLNGSVDIERFRFYNPPILVDDQDGDIIREWVDKNTGEVKQRKLREDLVQATKESLAHTVHVSGKEGVNIVRGSIGNTTSTFYPDASPETTSVDGYCGHNYATGSGQNWATITAAAGTSADNSGISAVVMGIQADNVTDKWKGVNRGIFLFDTSAISDTDSIDSAVLSLFGSFKTDGLSITPNVNIFVSSPASNTALVAADYAATGGGGGSVPQATAISYTNYSDSAYNDFTLNATGLTAINVAGVSKFSSRNHNYDADNVAPTWSSTGLSQLNCRTADIAGTTNDPKLVVTHTSPSSIKTVNNLAIASVKTWNNLAIASVKTWNNLA